MPLLLAPRCLGRLKRLAAQLWLKARRLTPGGRRGVGEENRSVLLGFTFFLPKVKIQLAHSPPFASEAVSGIYRGLNQGPISSEWKFLSLKFSGATGLLAFSLPGVQLRFSLENFEVLRSLRRYGWGMKTHPRKHTLTVFLWMWTPGVFFWS